MIVEDALVLQEKLRALTTAERRRKEANQIAHTYNKLQEISKWVQRLTNRYETVGGLLTSGEQEQMLAQLEDIYNKISNFAEEFQSNSDQVRKLNAFAESDARPSLEQMRDMWAHYVDREIRNESEIYLLVRTLPDVRSNGAQIDEILQRLNSIKQQPPASEAELTRFEGYVETLRSQIGRIQGLTPEVQLFLGKMMQNGATIADLTTEILDWCREPSRAKHFVIRFAEGT